MPGLRVAISPAHGAALPRAQSTELPTVIARQSHLAPEASMHLHPSGNSSTRLLGHEQRHIFDTGSFDLPFAAFLLIIGSDTADSHRNAAGVQQPDSTRDASQRPQRATIAWLIWKVVGDQCQKDLTKTRCRFLLWISAPVRECH